VGSFEDAGDYAAGVLGGLVPSAAVGVGAGVMAPASLGVAGAVGAGALAYTPFETGDIVGRMRSSGQDVDLGQAALYGGGSAVAQSLLPGLVAGKLTGRVGAGPGAAPVTLGSAGRSVVGGAGLEGGAEAGGEALKQVGAGGSFDNLDLDAVSDSAVAGMVGGSALAGVGAAGQAARQRAGDVGQGLDTAKNAATGLLARAKGGAKAGAEAVQTAGGQAADAAEGLAAQAGAKVDDMDIPGALRGLWDDASAKGRDVLQRMTKNEDIVGDVKAFAGVQGDRLAAMLKADDDTAMGRAKQAAADLYNEKLSPEDRAKLEQAAANLGDKANRAWVASKALAVDASKSARTNVQRFIDGINERRTKTNDGKDVKRSEVSATRDAVMKTVVPQLLQARPELADMDPKQASAFADALTVAARDLASGEQLSSDAIADMIDAIGPGAADVLDATQRAMGGLDETQRKSFYKALLEVDEVQKASGDMTKLQRESLVPGLRDVVSDGELRKEAQMLRSWATSSRKKKDDPQAAFAEKRLRDGLTTRYGDNADKLMAAVEKSLPKEENLLADEARDTSPKFRSDEDVTGEEGTTTTRTKPADRREMFDKDGELYILPEHETKKSQYGSAAEQAMRRAQAAYPGKAVRMTPASELGREHPMVASRIARLTDAYEDMGLSREEAIDKAEREVKKFGVVTVEGTKQETEIEPHEMRGIKLSGKFANSPSRLDTRGEGVEGNERIDAVKLTEMMHKRFDNADGWTEGDAKSGKHRTARMFMEGVAALQVQQGVSFDIPDTLVIDKQGTKWGDVKNLEFSTGSSIGGEAEVKSERDLLQELDRLRTLYAGAKADKAPPTELARLKRLGDRVQDQLTQQRLDDIRERSGRTQPDPFGNVSEALGGRDEVRGAEIRTNLSGLPRSEDLTNARTAPAVPMALLRRAREVAKWFKQPTFDTDTVQLGVEFPDLSLRMVRPGHFEILDKDFDTIHTLKKSPGGESLVVDAPAVPKNLPAPKPKPAPAAVNADTAALDDMLAKESYGSLNSRAAVDSFLADAKKRYVELQAEDAKRRDQDLRLPAMQRKALATLENLFGPESRADLASFYDGLPDGGPPSPKAVAAKKAALLEKARSGDAELLKALASSDDAKGLQRAVEFLATQTPTAGVDKALDAARGRLAELVRRDESVAYGLQTKAYSRQAATGAPGPVNRQEVLDYIGRVLGPNVRVAWANLAYAGEFERVQQGAPTEDVIRLSVHSLNPLSTAYHESLHAFFAKLGDVKQGGVMEVLNRAASSASVLNQLSRLLANEPAALKQLNNAEERAAYMYQFWAMGQLTVGTQTETIFHKIAKFIRSTLGMWSNDQRALHIMEYFHSGDFAKDSAKPFVGDTLQQKLLAPGRNETLQRTKQMTKPLLDFGEAVAVAGGTRMRESGVPALEDLANAMKLQGTVQGADPGFVPASRAERARVMNDLAAKLKGHSESVLKAALQSLQSKSTAPVDALAKPEDRLAARQAKKVVRQALDDMFAYMQAAGVKVNDLGVGADYFPRVYDTSFISSHQAEFKAVLTKHGIKNPEVVAQKLMVTDGAEFTVEVDKPGMQHLKPRVLAHIPDAELAPFMRQNLFEVLSSYVTQATRRAEWAKRFRDDGSGVQRLLTRAEREGATPDQIAAAQKFVRSVDGTLGDTISPEARRLMGNMIVYQNIRLLPLAVFSSVVDPMGVMVRGGSLNDAFNTFKRGIREIPKGFKDNAKDDDMTRLATALGTIDDAALTHTLGAAYSQGMVGDTGRKINDAFFRYNLMEQFGASMRVGATEAALNFLARHADGTADRHSTRWLAELGLRPGEVQLDASGRPKLFEADGLTLQQSARMKAAVNRWVDGAVLRPDAVDKPLWMSDPHFALISHLKQFVFAFHETILKRVAHEFENGNYKPAMALGSYVPIMIASDMVKGLIQGGGDEPEWKKNWTLGDYVASGVERAGLYGTGQFAVDMVQDVQRGGSGVGALLGPTVEQLTDAVRVLGGRGEFGSFTLNSMPAHALYAEAFGNSSAPVSDARVSE
jgi:hypothetical protein